MMIYAGSKGYLDKVPIKQVLAWETQFLTYMREQKPEVRTQLLKDRKLTPDNEKLLGAAIEFFQPQFKAG
jgi:F-type H+-transporting ATPase subunit alpha